MTSVAINVTASTVLTITYKDKVFESAVIVSVFVETCIVRSLDWMSRSGVCGILHLMSVHCGTREFSPLGPKLQPNNRRAFMFLRKTIGTEVRQKYVRLNFILQAEILTVSFITNSYLLFRDKWVSVTTVWCVFRLRKEEWPPHMEHSCEYIE